MLYLKALSFILESLYGNRENIAIAIRSVNIAKTLNIDRGVK